MKFNTLDRYQGWLHGVGWVIFVSLPFLTLPSFLWNPTDLLSIGMAQSVTCSLIAVFFYQNLNKLTPNLLTTHHLNRFVLTMLGMLTAVVIVKIACFYGFPGANHSLPGRPVGYRRSFWPGALSTALSFSFVMMLSSLIALGRHHARLREQQQQMVLGKVSAELAMLKLQVSPHFLFNTLNNIRWLARQKSEQTEASVVKLSQLLRYMLYQAQRDRVALTQEIEHLHHYIDLQQMRLNDRQTVDFEVIGHVDGLSIEPLLFIPFVENAFKYGLHGQSASHIQIRLWVDDNQLTFFVENPVFDQAAPASEDSGIGIANVAQRLSLHYPDHHTLRYGTKGGMFRVELTLEMTMDKGLIMYNA